MSKNFLKIIALICVALLTVVAFGGFTMADEEGAITSPPDIVIAQGELAQQASFKPILNDGVSLGTIAQTSSPEGQVSDNNEIIRIPDSLSIESGGNVTLLGYTEIPIYLGDACVGMAMKIGDSTYVPVGDFCEAIGLDLKGTWDQETDTAEFSGEGVVVTAKAGEKYIVANGRCFYTAEIININGTVVVPVRELAKCFGLNVDWNNETWSVGIDTAEIDYIEPAEQFYNEEDLYWLSRIIFAESGNQSIEGKIGVGNVVLNRVADPSCPDNVYDVIFDDQYGVQFSVTETGAIYLEPSEEAIIAAKICLEGYNVVGDSLFFVNPKIGVSSWFVETRTFVASIGEHDFYA